MICSFGSSLIYFFLTISVKIICCILNSHKFLASMTSCDKEFCSITASCRKKYLFLLAMEILLTCLIWYPMILMLKRTAICYLPSDNLEGLLQPCWFYDSTCHSITFSHIYLFSNLNIVTKYICLSLTWNLFNISPSLLLFCQFCCTFFTRQLNQNRSGLQNVGTLD